MENYQRPTLRALNEHGNSVNGFQEYVTTKNPNVPTTGQAPPVLREESMPSSCSAQDPKEQEKDTKRSIWDLISDWFVWEVSAIMLSLGFLIAIIIVLSHFNHQAQPTWNYMSLNSMISWLSTFSKGCVLFAISETIGQLKWTWLNKQSRPASHLRTFDSASRGLYGSAELIWCLRARNFVVFAGLATILATSFDPFIQNLIHYYPRLVVDPSHVALVGNNSYFGNFAGQGPSFTPPVDSALKANVYNAVLNSDEVKPWSIPNYTCFSGNCTWDPITALEMRASCTNITERLNKTCGATISEITGRPVNNCNITLPDASKNLSYVPDTGLTMSSELFVVGSFAAESLSSHCDTTGALPCLYYIAPDGLLDRVMNYTDTTPLTWQAMQCHLKPAVHSFRAYVTNGSYHEETLDIWENVTLTTDGFTLSPPWGPEKGMKHGQNFSVLAPALLSIGRFTGALFNGYTVLEDVGTIGYHPGGAGGPASSEYATADFVQAMVIGNMTGCTAQNASKLKCAMENTAAAISKTFRDARLPGLNVTYNKPQGTAGDTARGRVMVSRTYTEVHWQWISAPLLVWLLGCISLIGAIWKSHTAGVPKWKNDPIPLLFLGENSHRRFSSGGEKWEDNLGVKLYKGEDRFYLSCQS